LVVVAAMCTTGPAQAAWSKVRNVSGPGWEAQDSPQVSVDRQGDALFVWVARETAQPGGYYRVQARLKHRSGRLGPVHNLSPLGADPAWPQVASDDNGDAAVVWQQDGRVVGRRISASGAVGPLKMLSTTSATSPTVVVAPGGRALVVWDEYGNGAFRMQARFFRQDGSLGRVLDLGAGGADLPGLGIDRHGTAVLAWTEGNRDVVAQRIRPGHLSRRRVFSTPIADKGGFGPPSVAVDRDGDATVVFESAGGAHTRVWARRWRRGGALGRLVAISPRTHVTGFHYTVADDRAGDSIVAWTRLTDRNGTQLFARRLSWSGALARVTRLGPGDRPDVALDGDGAGLVVCHSPGAPYDATKVRGARIYRRGGFGPVRTFTGDGRVPQVDSSPIGRFTIVWQQASAPYRIRDLSGR
jgi:hypothetical protein